MGINDFDLAQFDTDDTLGFVTWYSVPDLRVTESQLEAAATAHGLDDWPTLGHPSDAFRRASSANQHREEGSKTRYLMRQVRDDAETIVREIVVERVNQTRTRLAHKGAVTITYGKASENIEIAKTDEYNNLTGEERAVVERLVQGVIDRYAEFTTSLTGRQLAQFATKVLDKLGHVSLRPNGGVYFVPRHQRENLESWIGFFHTLGQYAASDSPMIFAAVPVPNTPQQARQVADGLDLTVGSEVDQMVGKLADMSGNIGSVRQSTIEARTADIMALRRKVNEYERALGIEAQMTKARLELLDRSVENLWSAYADEQAKANKPAPRVRRGRRSPVKARKSA